MDIKQLGLSKETRSIRELITTNNGVIEVYEPTVEEYQAIIEMEQELGISAESTTLQIDGVTVVKHLFPMLTNIDLGDLSDEELEDVITNPTIHLLITQQVLAQIVSEANKLYATRIKTEIMNSDSAMAQYELLNSIPSLVLEQAKENGNIGELLERVERVDGELEKMIQSNGEYRPEDEVKDEKPDVDEQ